MPEYLAPGVYVEETSFRSRSVEGVSTSTAGFAGPTRRGPVASPTLVTSFSEFERLFGGFDALSFVGVATNNHLAHAVKAFFDNGGARLYVSRAFLANGADDGVASATLGAVTVRARAPGASLNRSVRFGLSATPAFAAGLARAPAGSALRLTARTGSATVSHLYTRPSADGAWVTPAGAPDVGAAAPAGSSYTWELLHLSVSVELAGATQEFGEIGLDPRHARYLGVLLAAAPSTAVEALENLISVSVADGTDAAGLLTALGLHQGASARTISLSGGDDGLAPTAAAYEAALAPLLRVETISIVAAPGASSPAVHQALVGHAETRRAYRIAVLDAPAGVGVSGALESRAHLDSSRAALYWPWVVVSNPLARPGDPRVPERVLVPPSGAIAGIYARSDVERGVHKAPANEIVRGALAFETDINHAENEVLNPAGVNCLRFFPGRGYRVWGARTASSDPEWKYVSVRRYFNYLEASVDRGTQWAVFEPNGEGLWANVRQTISSFLYAEWRSGALLGASEKEAYFVRCDRTTMTQSDLDNGRLVCLVGVAVVKPAEFVIFRVGQKTAAARD